MGARKHEPETRNRAIPAVSEQQLTKAGEAYRAATTRLYNLLLKDNGGDPLAALGALSIFRVRCEQHILDQIRGYAKDARLRRDCRGRDAGWRGTRSAFSRNKPNR